MFQSTKCDYPNDRQARRVPVKLQVAIGTRDHAYITESVDISEFGIRINNYEGPEMSAGRRVRVLIKGIISDDYKQEQFTTMYIARTFGRQVALTFRQELIAHSQIHN